MPINIDEVVTEVSPPPAPPRDDTPEPPAPAAPDPAAFARLHEHLAWRAARVAAD
jgi:hypothetical protein